MPEKLNGTELGGVELDPKEKKTHGIKYLMTSAASIALGVAIGAGVSPDAESQIDALLAAEKTTARVVTVEARVIPEHEATVPAKYDTLGNEIEPAKTVTVPERKESPFDKFNPGRIWKAGEGVTVAVRDKATDSLMYFATATADERSLMAVKIDFVPQPEPVEE